MKFSRHPKQLPAPAQTGTGIFAFLFNLIAFITEVLGLFEIFQDLFGPDEQEAS